ncbi:hypothetical protein [Frigoriglobus tundricola]|uniref:Uncharacterized protein n=1 Tax=Frigoriglobus tundricola TaxID=2774151 RepID=A0A6M5Z1I7_9BACT|nr:hypothetical protein [Frigoriglobus tundricola]QJW99281.1 hypothetical protein FTUN_6883 [Frigoriglobus tundricola]
MTPVTRTRLGLCVLVLPCLAYSVAHLIKVVDHAPRPGYVDRVTKAERRYDPVRGELPARGTVGYVLKVRSLAMLDWYQHYGLVFAQYTLAPLQVAAGDGYDVVLEEHDEGVRVTRRAAR